MVYYESRSYWRERDRAQIAQMVGRQTLSRLVTEAVDRFQPKNNNRGGTPLESDSRARALLILLAFCYVRGVYSSSNVESECKEDFSGMPLALDEVPDWNEIRTFRRQHRVLLRKVLAEVLAAIQEQGGLSDAAVFARQPLSCVETDDEDESKTNRKPNLFLAEADSIIRQAIQADSMVMDE